MSSAEQSDVTPIRRLAVRITKDAARQVRGGHPWVFDGSIRSVKPEGEPGDLAVIFDERRDFLAIGLYDPSSAIRIKVLHHGRPTPIDQQFWSGRLVEARERRRALIDSDHTTGIRLVHGENDRLPGVVLDDYAGDMVLKLYSDAWWPHLDHLVAAIAEVHTPRSLVLRLARSVRADPRDRTALIGEVPSGPVVFLENDLRFEADLLHGQKTGFFLDQRDNRARVRSLAHHCRVLDVFSCSGGFSVSAAAGGATLVHSIDQSAAAIAAAQRNMALNSSRVAVRTCTHQVSVGDAVTVMTQMVHSGRIFDVVVIDPPSYASNTSQVDGALRAYAQLTRLGLQLLPPGGTLVQASCSSRVGADEFLATVRSTAEESGVRLDGQAHVEHALDHPVGFAEGAYLKAIIATVHRNS